MKIKYSGHNAMMSASIEEGMLKQNRADQKYVVCTNNATNYYKGKGE